MLSIHFVLSTIKFHCVFLKYHFLPYLFSFEVFLPHIYKFYVKNIIHACPKISKYDKNFSLKTLRSVNRTSFPHIYTAYQSVCSSGRQFSILKTWWGLCFTTTLTLLQFAQAITSYQHIVALPAGVGILQGSVSAYLEIAAVPGFFTC